MFNNDSSTNSTVMRGALDVQRQVREQEKKFALLAAEYSADARKTSPRFVNPFKSLFASLTGGMKVPNRELASATRK